MKRNSSIDKASDFWSGTKISDIVMNLFNCGCGPRESKDQKNTPADQAMDNEETPAPSKNCKYPMQLEPERSLLKNQSPSGTFTFTFDQRQEDSQGINQFPSFQIQEEDEMDSERSRDQSSLFAGGDDEASKQNELDEGLSSTSKKISKKSQKAAEKANDKKMSQARRPWQPHEDKLLLDLMKELGPAWAAISKKMGGTRSGKQVRDRYLNKLDPKIKIAEWTEEEDNLLVSLYHKLGKKWSEIAKNIPGRTESMVKNRVQWRFRWMVSDTSESMEQTRSVVSSNEQSNKQETSQNPLLNTDKSNLMVAEEEQQLGAGFDQIHDHFQNLQLQPSNNYAPEHNAPSFFDNFELFPQTNVIQDRMQIDSEIIPQQNGYYAPDNIEYQYQDNFSLIDYFDKRDSSRAIDERKTKLDSDLYQGGMPNAQPNHQNNTYFHSHNNLPANVDCNNAFEDQKMQERLNFLSSAIKSQPGSENWSESMQKSIMDVNAQDMSKDDASRRVELLKQRITNLETILQITVQEVFKAQGKEGQRGSN